jgi:hypothetical protein
MVRTVYPMNVTELDGWIPLGLSWEAAQPTVDWCLFDGIRFTDPFFDTTVERAMRHPFRILFRRRTAVRVLEERANTNPGLPPSGFIFHMSRCGSTLIAQMLTASCANIVVSEGWPIDSVLNADARHPEVSPRVREGWFKAMLHALGRQRFEKERRYFVKFDARHALDLPLIRRAFPDVPWVFVYRDPVEVLVSHLSHPTLWTMPGLVPVRGIDEQAVSTDAASYPATVIAHICEAALRALGTGGGMLLNYTELPGAMYSALPGHFGCEWTASEEETIRTVSARNSKRPADEFLPDGHRKRQEASAQTLEACKLLLGEMYHRLEAIRTAQATRFA